MEYRGRSKRQAIYPSFTLVVSKHLLGRRSFLHVYRPRGIISWHSEPTPTIVPCAALQDGDWMMVSQPSAPKELCSTLNIPQRTIDRPLEEVDEELPPDDVIEEPLSPILEPRQVTDNISSLDLNGEGSIPECTVVSKRPRRVRRVFHVRVSSVFSPSITYIFL